MMKPSQLLKLVYARSLLRHQWLHPFSSPRAQPHRLRRFSKTKKSGKENPLLGAGNFRHPPLFHVALPWRFPLHALATTPCDFLWVSHLPRALSKTTNFGPRRFISTMENSHSKWHLRAWFLMFMEVDVRQWNLVLSALLSAKRQNTFRCN